MGCRWLWLLLLVTVDGALSMSASTVSAPNSSSAAGPSVPGSQAHAASAPPTASPKPSSSPGPTEQPTSVDGTQGKESQATLKAAPEGTMPSPPTMTSMSKDLRETSRATAAASKATSAETAELSQETPATTASASNSGVSGAESSVSPVSEKLAIVTSNTPGENTLKPLTAMHTVQRPGTTARTRTSGASPERTPRASPGAGACASDEHTASGGGCVCKANFYNHTELSRTSVALHCQPRTIEVVLHSCFLDTHHWMLKKGAFSGCSSVSTIQQSRRVQVFTLEKKEDACGLRLSTNSSHAVYSLEVEFLRVLPGFNLTDSTKLSFSCLYPLVVTVSQNQPYPVVSFPYSTIHIPGTGDVIVILGIFTDPQLSTPLENRMVPLGTPLHVVLRATSSDPDRFALVADEVFASTNTSRTGTTKTTYHFVKDSCPVSNRLLQGLQANGDSLQVTLAFNLFHLAARDPFYLHGRVTLCDKRAGRPCRPTCSPKPRAKTQASEMRAPEGQGRSSGWMVFGPIRLREPRTSSSSSLAGWYKGTAVLKSLDGHLSSDGDRQDADRLDAGIKPCPDSCPSTNPSLRA